MFYHAIYKNIFDTERHYYFSDLYGANIYNERLDEVVPGLSLCIEPFSGYIGIIRGAVLEISKVKRIVPKVE